MLGLELPTDPRWADVAQENIEDILVDHAYCEQKAASTCISLILGYPYHEELVQMLTPVVAEEWEHFERVLQQLKKRGYALGRQRSDDYVVKLNKLKRKGVSKEEELTDKLLICALIEARSCERFRILSEQLEESDLKEFYKELMVSEANHYMNFVKLAKVYQEEQIVKDRLKELLAGEAKIIEDLEIRGDRMH